MAHVAIAGIARASRRDYRPLGSDNDSELHNAADLDSVVIYCMPASRTESLRTQDSQQDSLVKELADFAKEGEK